MVDTKLLFSSDAAKQRLAKTETLHLNKITGKYPCESQRQKREMALEDLIDLCLDPDSKSMLAQ